MLKLCNGPIDTRALVFELHGTALRLGMDDSLRLRVLGTDGRLAIEGTFEGIHEVTLSKVYRLRGSGLRRGDLYISPGISPGILSTISPSIWSPSRDGTLSTATPRSSRCELGSQRTTRSSPLSSSRSRRIEPLSSAVKGLKASPDLLSSISSSARSNLDLETIPIPASVAAALEPKKTAPCFG